jgi:hypothetical protein
LALRISTIFFGAIRELPLVVLDTPVDRNEISLVKVDTAVKQLIHLGLEKIVHLIFDVVVGAVLITELVDQQILQLQPLLNLALGKLLLDRALDLVHVQL